MSLADLRRRAVWDGARVSAVLPVGLILAIAIVCIVVAVVTSARRAHEVALKHDEELLLNAIADQRERVLRELESVATTEQALKNIRGAADAGWIDSNVAQTLKTYFSHDYVFAVDANNRIIYPVPGVRTVDPAWFDMIRPDLAPVLDHLRGRPLAGESLRSEPDQPARPRHNPRRDRRVQAFMNRLAVVAAVQVTPADGDGDADAAPVVLSVKLIDEGIMAEVAARLDLPNLYKVDARAVAPGDHVFDLMEGRHVVARFAWTPRQRSNEIVGSVVPFVVIALAGLAFFAAFALRQMRRAAARISAGEDKLRHLALHDVLSGLPNRAYFGERLEAVITEAKQGGAPSAVFCIDLDHFKDVNDTLGHHVGDELIAAVTKRLRSIVRSDALVARLGGDEFAVITPGATDAGTLMAIADRILSALCRPYSIQSHTLVIGASVGIAVIDRPSLTAADVMRYADMALYRAKNEGRRRACIYDAAMDADLVQRKQLEHDLRQAIEMDRLDLAYQPVFSADGERVIGVEALARWNHPERGPIPPAEFIPIAEHSGLIIALGEWALRRACIDAAAWPVSVAVNVSPLQFRRPDFVDMVRRIVTETGFDPGRLELEITESTLLGNVEGAETAMHGLKSFGVRLALDDFGTGYSSLLYLRRFPFDKLKIDRSFIRNIESAAEAAPIVHAIVSLGRGLGMKVTAEGVETAEQHLFLRAAGVHFMQGYRFSKPESKAAFTERMSAQIRRSAPKAAAPVARAG
ncbi:MAG TPA: bifunctional diguanylate cyclase/phosphodiesterase [Xanthobacteraceae bacterium]|nr:bifunctional diguanylate cyclase/phosphodiesterase [Xanthobacteraceae bacterium]